MKIMKFCKLQIYRNQFEVFAKSLIFLVNQIQFKMFLFYMKNLNNESKMSTIFRPHFSRKHTAELGKFNLWLEPRSANFPARGGKLFAHIRRKYFRSHWMLSKAGKQRTKIELSCENLCLPFNSEHNFILTFHRHDTDSRWFEME